MKISCNQNPKFIMYYKVTILTSTNQSWYFGPFCRRTSTKQTFCQKRSIFGLFLPQKVLFHSWYMYVRHTIGIVISRAFSQKLNITSTNLKYCLIWVIRCCATDIQVDWLLQFQRHPPDCIGVHSNSFDSIFFYLHLCWALKYDC